MFGQHVVLRHPHKIHIGDHVVIDDNCLIDAKGDTNAGITIGPGTFIGRNTILSCKNGDIVLGEGANIGFNCEIFSAARVELGARALLAAYCYIIGGDHDWKDAGRPVLEQGRRATGVTVGAGAWLGAGAKVLDGITIGADAIVGAGAVVTADVPASAIVVGVPARVVGSRAQQAPGMSRRLNVLQVCDHLGLGRLAHARRQAPVCVDDPAVRRDRFNVSLVSLRKKDLSEETLDSLGVDIEYLHRSKFDPATLPALLKIIDRKQIDILHLHGYGATTFGRLAGAMRKLPTILHEHANLTDTPWFQKVADKLLEPSTDLAIAVSKSTAEFVEHARLVRPGEDQGRLSRRAARRVRPDAKRRGTGRSAGRHRRLARRLRDWHHHAAARLQRQRISGRGRGQGRRRASTRAVFTWRARARCANRWKLRRMRWVWAIASCSSAFQKDVAQTLSAFDLSVFPSLWEGTPLTAFEALAMGKAIVATDADGLLDILERDVTAWIVPRRDADRAGRRHRPCASRIPTERARHGGAREARRPPVRHRDVRAQDGAALHACSTPCRAPTGRRGILKEDLSFLTTGVGV